MRIIGRGLDHDGRKALSALVSSAEDRKQWRSALVVPLARLWGNPARVLMHEDLTGETLETLRERFGFDPAPVERRAAYFDF